MDNLENKIIRSEGAEILLYQAENGEIRIETRLQNDTIWLTQPLMAELYQTTQQNISQHIQNIYEEGELAPEETHKKFLSVRQYYNLLTYQDGGVPLWATLVTLGNPPLRVHRSVA